MKIIFNPATGADCPNFIFKNANYDGIKVGEMKQYDDAVAEDMVNRWEFLELKEPQEAKQAMGKSPVATNDLECSVCGKQFAKKIGLLGHFRSHKGSTLAPVEPKFDLSDIPVAQAKKVYSQPEMKEIEREYLMKGDLPNGVDKDGVDWYGDGLSEERNSLSKVTPIGQRGHFGA